MFVGFTFNKTNIFSRIIAWWTKSKWSHCFIGLYPIGTNDYLIMEAAFHGGVKFNLLSKYKKDNINLHIVPVSSYSINDLLPYIGANYGWKQIIGFVIAKCMGWNTNPISEDLVCSELVYLWLINHPEFKEQFSEYTPNEITPQDIYKELAYE